MIALRFLNPILALPLALAMLGERITGILIFVSFLEFGGVLLMSFAQLENGKFRLTSLASVDAGPGFAAVMAFIQIYVKCFTAKDSSALIALSFFVIASLDGLSTLLFGWTSLSIPHFSNGFLQVFWGLATCSIKRSHEMP